MSLQMSFDKRFKSYLEPVSELSRSSNSSSMMINSEVQMYNFDKISAAVNQKHGFQSADALRVHKKRIELIEFKTGFSKRITRDNWDPKLGVCPRDNESECEDYKQLFFRVSDLELSELRNSIRIKALESYVTVTKRIIPDLLLDSPVTIDYIVVIDGESTDQYESILSDIAKKKTSKTNQVSMLRESLKRLMGCTDVCGTPYLYGNVAVYTFHEYQIILDREKKDG